MLAHSHLAIADQSEHGAKDSRCLLLAVLNSYAVDYRKSGRPVDIKKILIWFSLQYKTPLLPLIYPYFMRKYNSQYESKNALGQIYRKCENVIYSMDDNYKLKKLMFEDDGKFDELLVVDGYEKYEENAEECLISYSDEILSIRCRWNIKTEIELFMNRPLTNITLPNVKDFEVKQKIKYQVNALKRKYRNIFFDEFVVDDHEEKNVVIRNVFDFGNEKKASAWYIVTMKSITKDTQYILSFPFIVFDVICHIVNS